MVIPFEDYFGAGLAQGAFAGAARGGETLRESPPARLGLW